MPFTREYFISSLFSSFFINLFGANLINLLFCSFCMVNYGNFIIRLGIGGLFIINGIMKLLMPASVVSMLSGLGFPAPEAFTWLLILSELVCGTAVIVGFKLRYSVVPLAIILLLGIILNPMNSLVDQLKNAALLATTIGLALSPVGALALKEHKRR